MAKKMDKTSRILMIVLIGVMVIVGVSLIKQSANEKTKTLGLIDWEIGAIDADGEFLKDTGSIVTKDFHNVEDLEIELAKDAMVSYKVFYYDEDEAFISASNALSADYAGTAPEGAVYFKLMVTPSNDAEVSLLEIPGYVEQISVVCAK